AAAGTGKPFRVDDLRPARGRPSRRIVIQPEDDVPHISDALRRLGHRAALLPAQVTVAASLIAAASEALRAGDFLLCSAAQAADLGLAWRPLAGAPLARGYSVAALSGADAEHVRADLAPHVARVLGAADPEGESR
ncbi:MAG TPA: LysR family transcriptional regulator, partial [Trebonia sp.]|nr:LysR family transcriptional regulator [Trebonia sp.]